MFLKNMSSYFPHLDRLLAVFVFCASFTVYLLTLAPTIYIEDAAEFSTVVPLLGIPHPSGFPLYILAAKLFTFFVPFGDEAFRVNLFSAFATSLAVSFLYATLRILDIPKIVAFSSALIFAFTQMVWHEATYAEVYALDTLFAALFLFFVFYWRKTKEVKYILMLFGAMGLSLATHLSILAYFPPIFVMFILFFDKKLLRWQTIFLSFLCLLLPLLLYAYIPFRESSGVNLSPRQLLTTEATPVQESIQGFAGRELRGSVYVGEKTTLYLGSVALDFFSEYPAIVVVVGVVGIFTLFFIDRKLWLIIVFLFLFELFGVIKGIAHGSDFSYSVWWFMRSFLPYIFIPFTIFFAYGAWGIIRGVTRISKSAVPMVAAGTMIFLLALPFLSLYTFWKINDKSQYYLSHDYLSFVLESLPSDSVLVVQNNDMNNDIELFSLAYLQHVEKMRTDVTILSDTLVFPWPEGFRLGPDYKTVSTGEQRLRLIENAFRLYGNRNIFSTFPADMLPTPYYSRSNGLVYQISSEDQRVARPHFQPILPRNIAADDFPRDDLTKNLAAKLLYHQSLFALERGQTKKAQDFFLKALDVDLPLSEYYGTYLKRRSMLQTAND